MHNEDILVPIAFFVMIAVTAIGVPLARAFARRMERQPIAPAITPELSAQIARMEQAIDSIAIEVERISEGQRFTTKLLAERNNGGAASESAARASGTVDMTLFAAAIVQRSARLIPPGAIEISEAFFVTIAVIALGIPLSAPSRGASSAARRRRRRCRPRC